jgi:hypothetical protein
MKNFISACFLIAISMISQPTPSALAADGADVLLTCEPLTNGPRTLAFTRGPSQMLATLEGHEGDIPVTIDNATYTYSFASGDVFSPEYIRFEMKNVAGMLLGVLFERDAWTRGETVKTVFNCYGPIGGSAISTGH